MPSCLFQMIDIRSVFDSDTESEGEPDAHEEGRCDLVQDNMMPLIISMPFDSSVVGWEMEKSDTRTLFCSKRLPLDGIAIGKAPALWGRFFPVDGYVIRVPGESSECSLEVIQPLDDIDGERYLFLYACSARPKPYVCIIVVE